ncbi:MAG TPA: SDR family NAD(P)-dependent oxidoreductase, partial [Puia sp.]|nr:SDR family NAD(P)-dependent oxidoreductase [Puia sp.]
MYSLKNKTAVVTGGGSGIGKAICHVFARAGARVYILDIDEKGSAETVQQIRQDGGEAEFLACSVEQELSVQHAIRHIVNIQTPDILVNN